MTLANDSLIGMSLYPMELDILEVHSIVEQSKEVLHEAKIQYENYVRASAQQMSETYPLISTAWANGIVVTQKGISYGSIDIANHANDEKSYSWKAKSKRSVQSAACALFMQKRHNETVYFITLTQPESIEDNKSIKLWVNNLKHRKLINQFVWVRERQKNGRNHYHVIFSSRLRFLNIKTFQRAWNVAMKSSGGKGSENSLRLGKEPIVRSIGAVSNYISKYMSKSSTSESFKLYDFSRGLQRFVQTDLYMGTTSAPYLEYVTEYALISRYTVTPEWWLEVVQYYNNATTELLNYETG